MKVFPWVGTRVFGDDGLGLGLRLGRGGVRVIPRDSIEWGSVGMVRVRVPT
jgi:hypothetical protein